jgi:hypothetical protein
MDVTTRKLNEFTESIFTQYGVVKKGRGKTIDATSFKSIGKSDLQEMLAEGFKFIYRAREDWNKLADENEDLVEKNATLEQELESCKESTESPADIVSQVKVLLPEVIATEVKKSLPDTLKTVVSDVMK